MVISKDKGEFMQESLECLKQYSIITPDEIQNLRHLLKANHPHLSDTERAQLFAQMLHKKLDEALNFFEPSLQKDIKRQLLEQTVSKPVFSINAFDIVASYTQVEPLTPSNVHLLTSWINQHDSLSFTDENLFALTQNESPKLSFDFSLSKWFSPKFLCVCLIGICTLSVSCLFYGHRVERQKAFTNFAHQEIILPITLDLERELHPLQPYLQYKEVNKEALNAWLLQKHSVLANEPYFSTIIDTAKSFNVNPLFLFAITGQEQNFVPSTNQFASQIANNPFNLYGSWQAYNTSIEDASQIVARTVINLGKGCPDQEDQIQWINQRYAADPNWHIGVTYFLDQLETATTAEVNLAK